MIPVGAAAGYSVAGIFAQFFTWRATFVIEGFFYSPIFLLPFCLPLPHPKYTYPSFSPHIPSLSLPSSPSPSISFSSFLLYFPLFLEAESLKFLLPSLPLLPLILPFPFPSPSSPSFPLLRPYSFPLPPHALSSSLILPFLFPSPSPPSPPLLF